MTELVKVQEGRVGQRAGRRPTTSLPKCSLEASLVRLAEFQISWCKDGQSLSRQKPKDVSIQLATVSKNLEKSAKVAKQSSPNGRVLKLSTFQVISDVTNRGKPLNH